MLSNRVFGGHTGSTSYQHQTRPPAALPLSSSSSLRQQDAALQGASLAFGRIAKSPASTVNTYSGPKGALVAATRVGVSRPSPSKDGRTHDPNGSRNSQPPRTDMNYDPLLAAQHSVIRDRKRRAAPDSSKRASLEGGVSSSNVAANIATNRHSYCEAGSSVTGRTPASLRSDTGPARSTRPSQPVPATSRLSMASGRDPGEATPGPRSADGRTAMAGTKTVETMRPPSTAALVGLFESNSTPVKRADATNNSLPKLVSSSPTILSPKPLRRISSTALGIDASPELEKHFEYKDKDLPHTIHTDRRPSLRASDVTRPVERGHLPQDMEGSYARDLESLGERRTSTTVDHTNLDTKAAIEKRKAPPPPPPARNRDSSSKPRSVPQGAAENVAVGTRPRISVPSSSTKACAIEETKHQTTSKTGGGLQGLSPSLQSSSRASFDHSASARSTPSRMFLASTSTGNEGASRSSARGALNYLTEDGLANAIVASSLASSRAPSPAKSEDPSLSRRHSRSHVSSHHHHHHHHHQRGTPSLTSRTPSPVKGLRQTMRKPLTSDDDDDETKPRRNRAKSLLGRHPNKHHEGSRKRWRDKITERERKRYEGVWAANKGVYVQRTSIVSRPRRPRQTASLAAETSVLNLVVRDIWSRSRLGPEALEEVWDLVDRKGIGVLDREEFVVGMWLIDQRLKGRKLPIKVSMSVWDSARAMGGIKIPNSP